MPGIAVNAILPGIVEGPRIEAVIRARAAQVNVSYEEMEARYLEKVSPRRMVTAEDVAHTVLFLVSPLGRNASGQSLGVCGNVETL
jgi:NAD(P)-dependent dehydrogenase (short-subunit alcohol dehydrogenase family)